mmetsp:Transcript_14245/g.56070  ORF Transcript_14245/g.56070 Transcript_14245/m.56070 type:complete len:247 (-) Transcript_14245:1029-1769(-)
MAGVLGNEALLQLVQNRRLGKQRLDDAAARGVAAEVCQDGRLQLCIAVGDELGVLGRKEKHGLNDHGEEGVLCALLLALPLLLVHVSVVRVVVDEHRLHAARSEESEELGHKRRPVGGSVVEHCRQEAAVELLAVGFVLDGSLQQVHDHSAARTAQKHPQLRQELLDHECRLRAVPCVLQHLLDDKVRLCMVGELHHLLVEAFLVERKERVVRKQRHNALQQMARHSVCDHCRGVAQLHRESLRLL